jgi:hypothetical protein
MPPILLIDMPAEGAARLLTLSLVEELARLGPAAEEGDGAQDGRWAADRVVAYHAAASALRGGVASFGDALRGSVTRKTRRRLRALARVAGDVRALDRQLVWTASYAAPPEGDGAATGDALRDAAAWLAERLARQRVRAAAALDRQHRLRQRVVRRLAKRLGVYTTELRLDEPVAQRTFAALTAQQLRAAGDAWREAIAAVSDTHDRRAFRRLLRIASSLERLLMPVQSYVSGALALRASVDDMLDILRRLDDAHAMHDTLVRAAERVAAWHAGRLVRERAWLLPASTQPDAARAMVDDFLALRHRLTGLVALADALRAEAEIAVYELGIEWLETGGAEFTAGIAAVAGELEAR